MPCVSCETCKMWVFFQTEWIDGQPYLYGRCKRLNKVTDGRADMCEEYEQ